MKTQARSHWFATLTAVLASAALPLIPVASTPSLTALLPGTEAMAQTAMDDRERKKLEREARRDRQAARKARNQRLSDAVRTLRLEVDGIENEYREPLRAIETAFDLERVRLEAETDSEITALDAALQKRLGGSLTATTEAAMLERLGNMEKETRAHQDRVFEARKQGAQRIHAARLAAELRKDALLAERDERILARAAELGLTSAPEPILAVAIGGELTPGEMQWNEREQRDVEKLRERHLGMLVEYLNGGKRRAWERANLEEDFALEWQERSELQALQSKQGLFNSAFMQTPASGETQRQELLNNLADVGEQRRQVEIRYEQLRRERDIKRREERRQLSTVVQP